MILFLEHVFYIWISITGSVKGQRKEVQQENVLLIVHTEDTQATVRVSLLRRRKVETIRNKCRTHL